MTDPATPADRAALALRLAEKAQGLTSRPSDWTLRVRSLLPALAADTQALTAERDTAAAVADRLLGGWVLNADTTHWVRVTGPDVVKALTDVERAFILHHREKDNP